MRQILRQALSDDASIADEDLRDGYQPQRKNKGVRLEGPGLAVGR
jgi:hypothetical protein